MHLLSKIVFPQVVNKHPGLWRLSVFHFSLDKSSNTMNRFIGRERELATLRKVLKKPSASVMIYGKRKVGKTTLIMQALSVSTDPTVYYECLKAPLRDNINGLTAELVRKNILPVPFSFSSFTDLFAYLNSVGKTLNIVIDEYP